MELPPINASRNRVSMGASAMLSPTTRSPLNKSPSMSPRDMGISNSNGDLLGLGGGFNRNDSNALLHSVIKGAR